MFDLIPIGLFVGMLSGFFGIGGGTILVPILLMLGYETKIAIGISVVQMIFSSVYGSYLNNKKGSLNIKMVAMIGSGGFLGALLSGYITSSINDFILELIFLSFAIFALIRLFFKPKEKINNKEINKFILFMIGLPIGAISMTIGVGGSILLVPILVGFLHIDLKKALSAGLFFVVFSSVSGLISHAFTEHIDFYSGTVIGLASLLGVYIGIHLKDKIDAKIQKRLLVGFYLLVVLYLTNRIFNGQ